jgi:hypothetical protein
MVDADCSFYSRGVSMCDDPFSKYVKWWVEGATAFFRLTDEALAYFDTIEVDAWRGENIEPPSKRATWPNRQVAIALDNWWQGIVVYVRRRKDVFARWTTKFMIHCTAGTYSLERVG